MKYISKLRAMPKILIGLALVVFLAAGIFMAFGFDQSRSQPATAQTALSAPCVVTVKDYTISSTGPTDACNFTLDLSQSGLRNDMETIKKVLATLPGEKSIEAIKSILRGLADKSDVDALLTRLDSLNARGYETKFGFGSKLGAAVFATSFSKRVGDLSLQASGYASLPSDVNTILAFAARSALETR